MPRDEINRSPDEMATAMEPVFEEGIQSLKAHLEQP